MRGTWRKKHSDFENSFSHEFCLLNIVRAQPAWAMFCIQQFCLFGVAALPCLGLAPHLAPCTAADPGCPVTNLPAPPPTSHIPPQPTAPPTKQLRCNYLGRRSPHRKHRGGWSHAATPRPTLCDTTFQEASIICLCWSLGGHNKLKTSMHCYSVCQKWQWCEVTLGSHKNPEWDLHPNVAKKCGKVYIYVKYCTTKDLHIGMDKEY